jgi:hypothetical protein
MTNTAMRPMAAAIQQKRLDGLVSLAVIGVVSAVARSRIVSVSIITVFVLLLILGLRGSFAS